MSDFDPVAEFGKARIVRIEDQRALEILAICGLHPNDESTIQTAQRLESWLQANIRAERIANQKHWIRQWQKEVDRMESVNA